MIFNQFKLFSILEPSNKESYKYYMDILTEGIIKHYPDVLESICSEGDEVRSEVSDEVDMLIVMFNKIENALNLMEKSQKRIITDKYHVHFNGFDPDNNKEIQHYTYFNFLKRYGEVCGEERSDGFNLSLHHYRWMIKKYEPYMHSNNLSVKQIKRICLKKGDESRVLRPIYRDFSEAAIGDVMHVIKDPELYLNDN